MNKTNLLYFIFFLILSNIYQNHEVSKVNENPAVYIDDTDTTGAQDLQDLEDAEILKQDQSFCEGECVDIPIDLPSNGSWVQGKPIGGWTSSHGTPTVGPNLIWLWSHSNYGEGVNLEHSFQKNMKYCIQTTLSTKVQNNQIANSTSNANIILTTNRIANSPLQSTSLPSIPSNSQTIWQQNFIALPSATATYTMHFQSLLDYNNIWFHPRNSGLPQVELAIRNLRICKVDLCRQVDIEMQFQDKCSIVNFSYNISHLNSGVIVGQTWNFGDGNFSNDANPVHNYDASNSFNVSLTLHIKFGDKCCTKTISQKIGVRKCEPCKQVGMAQVTWNIQGNNVTFKPDILHNSYFYYQWQFSDGTTYSTREVVKSKYSVLWGTLKIYYADPSGDLNEQCCERQLQFRYDGKLQTTVSDDQLILKNQAEL